MKRKDHQALAHFLMERTGECPIWEQPWHRRLFLCGCITPDYLPNTYFCGFGKEHTMRGHHASYSYKKICRILERLQKCGVKRRRDCFRLGLLMHYVSDSFTYPHTDGFTGDMKEHRKYEKTLHGCFGEYLCAAEVPMSSDAGFDGEDLLTESRQAYDADSVGMERDCNYILNACTQLFSALCRT
ncbi:MAG: zinc dependent phospholipase C family protein [Clostridia bacterium]|nr:zinc dependent phospholipase C family protein [Clostridia bacterium]